MIQKKIGVLGGGQLGKMLCQYASKMGINLHILEKDDSFPAVAVSNQVTYGDFKNFEDVYAFGQSMDVVTVEIEAVNTDALHKLVEEGKEVYPQPHILDTIKNKGHQKTFYESNKLPTSRFQLFDGAHQVREAVIRGEWTLPFVQKSQTDGYDGQGVKIVRTENDLNELLDVPCLLEDLVDIDREIAVIVARNVSGEVAVYPAVEMEFHPTANLVEFLFSPSTLTESQEADAKAIATSVAETFGIVGLLAVELFLTKSGEILINEVAPRPHNSGHHTIEANTTSQYEQHVRAIADLPLGNTDLLAPAAMINLLGAEGSKGPTAYENTSECLAVEGAHFHLYGKAMSKPYRKMGHVTVVDKDLDKAKEKARYVKSTFKITGNG